MKISIIPYSQGVRLSSTMAKNATDDYSSKCATERTGDQAYTDASYTTEPIGNGSDIDESSLPSAYSQSAGACPDDEILPLTSSKTTLLAKIDALTATGGTAGQTGIAWGWYTLSPNWTSLWPTGSEAASYSDDETLKYMIIMTDGEFNAVYDQDYITTKTCTSYKRNGQCEKYTTSKTTSKYWYETYDTSSTASADRAKALCTALKSSKANQGAGVTIYSVYFNPTSDEDAEATMESCASSSDKFTKATSGQSLTTTFVKYAQDIQKLYLSK